MPTYVEVAVNVPQVTGEFHYHLPPELEGEVEVGHLLEVPFGAQRVQGVVLDFVAQPAVAKTRPVVAIIDPQAVVTPLQIDFARQLAHDTLAPLAACIELLLPPGLGQQADTLYQIRRSLVPGQDKPLTELQKKLVGVLHQRGPLRGRQIDQALPRRNWRAAAQSLLRREILQSQPVLQPPSVKPKAVRTAQLACSPERAAAALPQLGRAGSAALERRQRALRFLLDEPEPVEVAWIYAESGANLADLRLLAERGLILLGESEVWRDPLEHLSLPLAEPPALTRQQQACWQAIYQGMQRATSGEPVAPFLLHGVTGSGKTEIYLQAVAAAGQMGKQAIVLVPEIALTPQTVRRFVARFPGQVGLVHSGLSPGERYDTWRRARSGELSVMIGPRSALFSPLPNLGLIVVDECHDSSYYQSEPPFYHAREAAVTLARLAGGVCLLGSATPEIISTYRAAQGDWQYLKLPERILGHRATVQAQASRLGLASRYRPLEGEAETIDLPPVEVVDMRAELKSGNSSIFSRALQRGLQQVLDADQQAILFLNRRGTATYIFCRDCGHTLKCPHCDLPLTYHESEDGLLCHHCGYRRKMPTKCPQCDSTRIRQYGTGTEKVESEVHRLFPPARTLRWDYGTTRQKGAHEAILNQFASRKADILVGTQMLAKGLDLPLVTLVGVILADVGLNMPDYSAGERTFQTLTQVAGRAGRSPLGGQVVLQTFQPEHYVIQAAARHNYRQFYHQELEYRRKLSYPPFTQLVRLEIRHTDPQSVAQAAQGLADQIQKWIRAEGYRATDVIGPVPCFFSRVAGLYRWQLVLRGPNPAGLLRGRALTGWRVEVNPPSLL